VTPSANRVLRVLKPTALSILVFFTIILPGSISLSPISVTLSPDGATHWNIPWPFFAWSLAGGYLAALALAVLFKKATGFRRPVRAYLLAGVIVAMLAFLAAVSFSKAYWGYFFFRPSLLAEFNSLAQVSALVPVETPDATTAPPTLVPCGDSTLAQNLAYAEDSPYDYPAGRLLLALRKRHLLPAVFSSSLSNLPPLLPLAQASGLMAASDPGYESERFLRGMVVDALDPAGARIVLLGLHGGQLSNDHYPYYEMLFTAPAGSSNLKFVRGQRFFFDIAGIEGAEWYVMGVGFSLLGIPMAFAALIATMAIGRGIARFRQSKRADFHPPDAPA
jgi:hypothetical protein